MLIIYNKKILITPLDKKINIIITVLQCISFLRFSNFKHLYLTYIFLRNVRYQEDITKPVLHNVTMR